MISNIKFVDSKDEGFLRHNSSIISKYRKKRLSVVRNDYLRKYEQLSVLLEKTVFHWTKSTDKRIIKWSDGKNENNYSETDFVIEQGDKYIIGEVKSKLRPKSKAKALGKILKRKSILDLVPDKEFEYFYVKICMSKFKKTKEFKEDFFEIENEKFPSCDFIKMINLFVDDVFQYGIENGIIENKDFLKEVREEIELFEETKLKIPRDF